MRAAPRANAGGVGVGVAVGAGVALGETGVAGGSAAFAPAIDLYQTENDIVVKAAVPGMKPEDVQINVTGDLLTIKGEMRESNESKDKSYQIREQHWGALERTIQLPTLITAEKAKADFENGILTITLPKAEEVKPKTITVKAK